MLSTSAPAAEAAAGGAVSTATADASSEFSTASDCAVWSARRCTTACPTEVKVLDASWSAAADAAAIDTFGMLICITPSPSVDACRLVPSTKKSRPASGRPPVRTMARAAMSQPAVRRKASISA